MRATVIAVLCVVAASPALAGESGCRTVHGRMSLANGTPSVRIWVIGSHRMLGVIQQDEAFTDLPANIRQLWSAHGDDAMWSSDLFGDFRVCPLRADRPGHMQPVRLEAASNLRLRPRS